MIVKEEEDEILSYLEDSSNIRGGKAETLYIPENEKEVMEVVKECASKKIPLTVSGGGTGTVGGRIPFEGAILSTERLNKIKEINKEGKRAVLQAGVIIDDFLKTLDREKLFYPPFPTERTAFIGGNVSTNASGEYSYHFGSTRNYVKRIKVILSTGKILDIERGKNFANQEGYLEIDGQKIKIPSYISPSIKNSAGYFSQPKMDLIDLFIGSEGTLGVIVEIEADLIPTLLSPFIMIVFFKEDKPLKFISEVKRNKKLSPLSLEYFDRRALDFLKKDFPNIPDVSQGAIYTEQEEGKNTLEEWAKLTEGYPVIDIWIGKDERSYQKLVDFRHRLPENINDYFKRIKSFKLATDIAVPEDSFEELVDFYKMLRKRTRVETVLFGHIGENHLHFNLFPKDEMEKKEALKICESAVRKGIEMKGTVSAEHGIGKLKHKHLEMMFGKEGVMEMVRVKKELDPFSILGLNNIFPKDLLSSVV